MELKRELGLYSAIFVIIADVIGTGIFMTTGSILGMTKSAPAVLALWAVGGLVALTGSLCYSELATMWPDVGGEYIYLKKIYGLLPSFLTGWISLVVGFTASAAITSITIVAYLAEVFKNSTMSDPLIQKVLAASIIVFFGIMHITGVKKGGFLQNILTALKIIIIFAFIIFGFYMADWSLSDRLTTETQRPDSVLQYGFALLSIMFAYSGWNGATYIAGEIKDPSKNLPRALFTGTLLVTVIYILLNIVYLMSTPMLDLCDKEPVGSICALNLFGPSVAPVFTFSIAFILLSSVSVQMMVGPRVYYAMAKDRVIFQSLSRIHPKLGTPYIAIMIQMLIAVIYVFVGRGNIVTLLIYLGFALSVFPLLTVIGLMILRHKHPELHRPFKVPLYPLVPLVYITLTLLMMISSMIYWTKTSLVALGVVLLGTPIYFIWQKFIVKK